MVLVMTDEQETISDAAREAIANLPSVHEVRYGRYRSLFSNGYIRRFYQREASYSPSLSKLDAGLIKKVIDNDIDSVNSERVITVFMVLLFIPYAIIALQFDAKPWYFTAQVSGGLVILGIEILLLRSGNRKRHEQYAADALFFAILVLESNIGDWDKTKFRWRYAARLERLAKQIERIPLALRKVAPTVRRECLRISGAKAQAVRELELSVIKRGPSTFEDIAAQLIADLHLVIDGRWYELPEAPYERQISRLKLAMQIIGAIIAFGGAVTIVAFTSKLGPGASILATVLIAISVALLNFSGLSTEIVGRYVQTGSDVMPKK